MRFHLVLVGILISSVMVSVPTNVSGKDSPFICPSLGLTGQQEVIKTGTLQNQLEQDLSNESINEELIKLGDCHREILALVEYDLDQIGKYRGQTFGPDECPEHWLKENAEYNLSLYEKRDVRLNTFQDQGLDFKTFNNMGQGELEYKHHAQKCLAYFEKREKDKSTAEDLGEKLGVGKEDVEKAIGDDKQIKEFYDENCLIATAAYGSALSPEVQMLREIRDHKLLATSSGTSFMAMFNKYYYTFSPTIADWENQNPIFREMVRGTITPLISSLSILKYVDMDSEAKVLTYGIGIILLNIGMYFVGPAFVVFKVRNHFRR